MVDANRFIPDWLKAPVETGAELMQRLRPQANVTASFYPDELRERLASFPITHDIGAKALNALLEEAQWFSLPGGMELDRHGDNDQAVFLVVAGNLGVYTTDDNRDDHLVANVPAGETVGEMSIISGDAHSAKLVALRDSELLRIGKQAFEGLIARHPRLSLNLMRLLVRRLRQTTRRSIAPHRVRTIALLPLHAGVDCQALSVQLGRALGEMALSVGMLGPETAGRASDWFARYEAGHDIAIYHGTMTDASWMHFALRQADRVVLVGHAGGHLPANPIRGETRERLRRQRPELVLLRGPGDPGISKTPEGLESPYGQHHYIDPKSRADIARLARLLSARAVGLVLAGGGARGFAHIGVVRALREAGVPFDLIGGASMGAIVAAGVAMGWDNQELTQRMRRAFVETNPLNDFTLPLLAVFRGKKVTAMLREHFGDMRIEDMPRTFFAVSSNLTAGTASVHRTGPVWRALRASVAIPGLLPPIIHEKNLLVDGGLMNNFPVDIMASYARGPIIGVDVAGDEALVAEKEDFSDQGWYTLLRQQMKGAPSIVSILMRSGTVGNEAQRRQARDQADVLFDPPLEGIGLRSWQAFDRAVEEGYAHAAELIEANGLDFLWSIRGFEMDDAAEKTA